MTKISFLKSNEFILGFSILGHSTKSADDLEGKIVCSAISSVAYMVVNTLTDVINAKVEAEITDGGMKVKVLDKIEESQDILCGLKLHFVELSKDYPEKITINSEV